MPLFGTMSLVITCLIACQSPFAEQALSQNTDTIAVVEAVTPFYPPLALTAHISGDVIVEVKVNRSGKVTEVKALEGHKLLRPTAERAAKRWVFTELGNGAAMRQVKLRFKFTLLG